MKIRNIKIKIREIKLGDYEWIKKLFKRRWGGEFIVTRGKIHKINELKGYIAEVDKKRVGLITYKIRGKELEIVSLDSILQGKGIGTRLIKKVISLAKKKKLTRIWLITTNDNLKALGFWQRRKFVLVKVYPNALKISRKLKPNIPLIGAEGIPLRDEIELEMKLRNQTN